MPKYIQGLGVLTLAALFILTAVSAGEPADDFNGTTFRLGASQVEVIQPVNASRLNLTLSEKASNITLLESGKSVPINSSYTFWRGDHIYRIAFGKHVSGTLIYTMPHQGQQFVLPMRDSGPVRVVLPPGYTTGDRILGIARPDPDEVMTGESGTALTWQNTSLYQIIEVSYYPEKAPEALKRVFAVLIAAAIVLLIEYYASIRKLRAIREDVERRA
jgi:hypothetical protein